MDNQNESDQRWFIQLICIGYFPWLSYEIEQTKFFSCRKVRLNETQRSN